MLLFFLYYTASLTLWGQASINITGTVTSPDGQSLIGVNVLELGSGSGTITDVDGRYALAVAANATLQFSYLGFQTQKIPIAGRTQLDVILQEAAELLNEVVVTGYKKEIKSAVATAISSIKSADIEKLVVMGIDQALQGQAPGIMVTQTTGAPGDDIAVILDFLFRHGAHYTDRP